MDRREFLASTVGVGIAGAAAASARNAARELEQAGGPQFLTALQPPSPDISVYEPFIAIDPHNPDRIAVAAQYGLRGGRGALDIQLWVSRDAGRTWFSRRVPRPRFDGGWTADPLVAFDTGGSILVVGDCGPAEAAKLGKALAYDCKTLPTLKQLFAPAIEVRRDPANVEMMKKAVIGVSRSEDDGRTLTGTVMPDVSPSSDRSAIAVDRSATSPHKGTVYVSWSDETPSLRIARSTDGGRTFAPSVSFKQWGPTHGAQVAVRPDGSVHLVWSIFSLPGITDLIGPYLPRGDEPVDAWKHIYHAVSTDGGATFSGPTRVATHAGPGKIGLPTLASDAAGRLLFVYGQAAEALPDPDIRPVRQARHRLYAIRSEDGIRWSAPYKLCPQLPATLHMGLPTITNNGKTWWIITYLADDEGTRVALLRSDNGGESFTVDSILSKRSFTADKASLMGSALARYCDDIPQAGDYVGVSAVGSRVAAAFVLPESSVPTSRATVYVAVNDVR